MKLITKQTYKLLWQHMRQYKLRFWVIIFSIASAGLVVVIIPLYYKKFFDILSLARELGAAATATSLMRIVFIVLALNSITWILYRLATFTNNYFQPRVMADIMNTCFEYLHQHSFGFFINRFVGSLVRRVNRLVRAFEDITDSLYWNLLPTAMRIMLVLLVVFYNYTVLGLIILAWVAIYFSINYVLTLHKLKLDEVATAADSRVTGYLSDAITNQANVKMFTALPYERRDFNELTNEQFSLNKKSWNFDATVEAVQGGFMFILEFIIFYFAVGLWQQGRLTVGDFVLVQAYLLLMFGQLWDFGRVIRRIYRSLAEAEEMVEILHTPHQVKDKLGAPELQVRRGEVEFRNIEFTYTEAQAVVKNFNLKVAAGEKVALVGPSGAGKSTLVALLLRFYDLKSGAILIDGQNIAEVTQESLRRNISFVPQDPILFHRTLMENIRYGRREASDAAVKQAAVLAHCDEFIKKLPQQYETLVGERGVKLSGGERQRVVIARAILKNAPLLVLDEATSSLDSQAEVMIQAALTNLMRHKTTIVIAHRLSTIMKMDRIVVVSSGKIEEIGSHQELLNKSGGLYRKLWELQVGGFVV